MLAVECFGRVRRAIANRPGSGRKSVKSERHAAASSAPEWGDCPEPERKKGRGCRLFCPSRAPSSRAWLAPCIIARSWSGSAWCSWQVCSAALRRRRARRIRSRPRTRRRLRRVTLRRATPAKRKKSTRRARLPLPRPAEAGERCEPERCAPRLSPLRSLRASPAYSLRASPACWSRISLAHSRPWPPRRRPWAAEPCRRPQPRSQLQGRAVAFRKHNGEYSRSCGS